MTEQEQIRKLNKTPLSLECRRLIRDPAENGLYLLQALQQALEEDQPDWESSVEWRAQTIWRTTRDLLEEMSWSLSPETAYSLLTTCPDLPEGEMTDMRILEKMKADPEDELYALLDVATMNLESNGFSLDGTAPIRD